MRRIASLLLLTLLGLASRAVAQTFVNHGVFVSNGLDQRFEALNAVLRFREHSRDTNTVIAQCRLFEVARDSSQWNALDQQFRDRLVLPATKDTSRLKSCGVSEFAVQGTSVLWLDHLVEITRSGEMALSNQKQFEITFELLLGSGYREYHRYLVGPSGTDIVDSGLGTPTYKYKWAGWRVFEYKFLGADFDWGTGLGASSGFRRN